MLVRVQRSGTFNPVRLSEWTMSRCPPRNEKSAQTVDEPLLSRTIEIDHNIAAEDQFEGPAVLVTLDQVQLEVVDALT